MGSKKDRAAQPKKKTPKPDPRFGQTLADQLRAAGLKPDPAPAQRAKPQAPAPPARPQSPPEPDPSTMPDDALFAHALDKLAPEDVFRGKYVGDATRLPRAQTKPAAPQKPDPAREADEAHARQLTEQLREEALFERSVGPVEALGEHNKYYVPTPGERAKARAAELAQRTYTSEAPDGLITPTLPKEGEGLNHIAALELSQKGLIKRYKLHNRREQSPSVNLREDTLEDALRQLELFMHKAWKDNERYVRVIHGRGVHSEAQRPVLKPAVLQWLEGPGLRYIIGYAPELTSEGDYGSLIIAMRRKPPQD